MKEIAIIMMTVAAVLFASGCTGTGPAGDAGLPGGSDITGDMTEDTTEEFCDQRYLDYVQPEPVDTSVPVEDPLPGLKYSFGINDSGRMVTMDKDDTFEITLRYSPSLVFRWTLINDPEGLVLLNSGDFSAVSPDEEDYMQLIKGPWNSRWRYLAATKGTYRFDGILAIDPCSRTEPWDRFNLTVVVV